MSRWLSRFSFPLVAIAMVLAWEGYRTATGRMGEPSAEIAIVWWVAAAVLFVLGLIGLRERHRPRDRDS